MLWARAILCAATVVLAGGCPSDNGPGDQPDAGRIDGDGGIINPGSAGLEFRFESIPSSFPGEPVGEFSAEIEEVKIILSNVRALGDGADGDERTTLDRLELSWPPDDDDDDGGESGYTVTFRNAPAGIYSELKAQVVEYEISGRVEVDDDDEEFEIEDEPLGSLSLVISLGSIDLPANESQEVAIEVDLERVVSTLPWDTVEPDDDGSLSIEDGPLITVTRGLITSAFEIKQ